MAGQLNKHPLAELIREISAAGLSGALRLSRERAKIAVYFEAGEVIYAGSNLRTYRLSECVRRWRVLTAEQLARVRVATSDLEFGASLVKIGMLSRDALNELLVHQASEILCHALLWADGDWEFDPRVRISSDLHVNIKIPELLIEGARRLPPELAASRFSSNNEKLYSGENAPENFALLPTEAFVLTRLDGPMRVHELVAISGLSEHETLRIVYALALGGFLKRDGWPTALTQEEVSRARAIPASPPKPAAPDSKVEVKSPPSKKAAPAEVVRDDKADLEALFGRLRLSTNFYQMLGLVRPATDADVKRAYHGLAKRFHPDRFRKTVDDELHARIESAFVNIAEAYETLKHKQSRAAYDSKLLTLRHTTNTAASSQPPSHDAAASGTQKNSAGSSDAPPPRSTDASGSQTPEQHFQQGLSALESGNRTLAIASLGEAARLDPSQPRYRAHYGRALAGEERLRRSAEAEIKAAVDLDANNPSYRVMLAEFYVGIGFVRRAQTELRRVLSIDPGNVAAQRLLAKLG